MSYNYPFYVTSLQTLLVAADTQGQANLNAMLPNIIDYAEQRIYRELDFLTTLVPLTNTCSAYSRNIAVPQQAIVVQSMNIITPASTSPDNGTRNPVERRSVEYINYTWPTSTTLGLVPSVPQVYALQNNNGAFTSTASNYTAIVAPPPDSTYVAEFICTIRPPPLSQSNPNTFLTVYLPDLFLAASMVFASGYQRDFGATGMVDDVGLGVTWEKQYQTLKASADIEELRKKAESQDWTSFTPSPIAGQPR